MITFPNAPYCHKEAHSSARAATPYRGAAHQLAKEKSRYGPPPRGDWSEVYSMQSQVWSEGGSPEGADVPNANSAAPSGPLCFFLRVEKEELTQQPINKGIVSMADGGTPSGFVRSRATSRIHLPREGGFGRFPWSRHSKGERFLCGCASCFSNPGDSRKMHRLLRCGAEASGGRGPAP